jgi:hypothetical protein
MQISQKTHGDKSMGVWAYGKKFFSIALIFNCLVVLTYAIGLLSGFYTYGWLLFTPYIADSNLFWLVIMISVFNIFPAAYMGRVKTGRLWFHHYFWGILVICLSLAYLAATASWALPILFTSNITDLSVNLGRFFLLGGLALLLDDLPDVSGGTKRFVSFLKSSAHQSRRIIHYVEFLLGLVSTYFFVFITAYLVAYPVWATPANCILSGCLLVMCLTCFWTVKKKVWLNFNLNSGQE